MINSTVVKLREEKKEFLKLVANQAITITQLHEDIERLVTDATIAKDLIAGKDRQIELKTAVIAELESKLGNINLPDVKETADYKELSANYERIKSRLQERQEGYNLMKANLEKSAAEIAMLGTRLGTNEKAMEALSKLKYQYYNEAVKYQNKYRRIAGLLVLAYFVGIGIGVALGYWMFKLYTHG